MTRETKVGLLVGMGVILLVGIIVSDQLSNSQQEYPADLTGFASDAQQDINPLDSSVGRPVFDPPTPAVAPIQTDRIPRDREVAAPVDSLDSPTDSSRERVRWAESLFVRRIENARRVPPVGIGPIDEQNIIPRRGLSFETVARQSQEALTGTSGVFPSRVRLNRHTVVVGDSLYRIAQQYLGDGNRWREIAKANAGQVGTDGQIRIDIVLTIPNIDTASSQPPASPRSTVVAATVRSAHTYTVQAGDSLYAIAQRELGDGSAWKKIYDANRDRLSDPDTVKVGQTLRLPG